VIKGRHIRHDWQTFVDWEQKSVMTACGMKSQRHLSGIPGITEQDPIVEVKGRSYWGWCPRCVNRVWQEASFTESQQVIPEVAALYERVVLAIAGQHEKMRERAMADAKTRHLDSPRHQSGACLTDGRGCPGEG